MRKTRVDLSAEYVCSVLAYDPIHGIFVWKRESSSHRTKVGDRAGYIADRGYRYIGIDNNSYRASRLAWLIMTGDWPEKDVDHKNTITSDDRWCNLRLATISQNNKNKKRYKNIQSGFKGVVFHRPGWWKADIRHQGIAYYIGLFQSPLEAHEAYLKMAFQLDPDFARAA